MGLAPTAATGKHAPAAAEAAEAADDAAFVVNFRG